MLRAKYQSVAPVSSVRAAGWSSTFGIQASVQLGANLLPGNGLDFARFELMDTTLDLFSPCSLDVLVRFSFQALEQEAGKFCSLGFRKFRCLTKQVVQFPSHRTRFYLGENLLDRKVTGQFDWPSSRRSSSPSTNSSRSAWPIDSSSCCFSSADTRNVSVPSRVRIVTFSSSGRGSPSTTIRPSCTVPVMILKSAFYSMVLFDRPPNCYALQRRAHAAKILLSSHARFGIESRFCRFTSPPMIGIVPRQPTRSQARRRTRTRRLL